MMGYFGGFADDVIGRFVDAFLALPGRDHRGPRLGRARAGQRDLIVVIGVVFTPLIARTVRAAVLLERELDYVAAARLRGEGRCTSCSSRSCRTCCRRSWSSSPSVSATRSSRSSTLTFLGFGIQPPSPDWGLEISDNYGVVAAGYWWEVLFAALAIASLVVGVNLVADSVEQVFER